MAREGLMDDCGYDVYVDEEAYNDGFKEGFLKAVDEFAEKLKEEFHGEHWTQFCTIRNKVDEIAEQLKGE